MRELASHIGGEASQVETPDPQHPYAPNNVPPYFQFIEQN